MQPQYSQGAAPSHHPPPYAPPEVSQANGGSITSSLRQWRKKDYLEKQQTTEQPQTSVAENPSHVARVAPHTYYPRLTNDVCHYQHQYSEYGVPYKPPAPTPVKYSEIVDNPQAQTIEHITPVIPKLKDKDFGDLCSVPPQPHLKQYQDQMPMKQPYSDGAKQTYSDPTVHHQYISKESQIHPFLQKQSQMHQYIQKEPYQQFLPKYGMQGQYPQSYPSEPNNFLAHLNKINPRMAQSIINDTHLRDPQIPMYHTLDQSRSYPQPQRMYHAPPMHTSPTHAHRSIPQSYNYPQPYNYNVKSNMQPNDPYSRVHQYQHNVPKYLPDYKMNAPIEQPIPNISPQRVYNESVHMNYAHMPPKISPNYPHCGQLEYAQHYQHRRAQLAQEYYPHSAYKSAYVQNPQVSPEGGGADGRTRKSSLKQYLETWVEEDMSGNLPDLVVSNNLNDVENMENLKGTMCVKGSGTQEQPLYVLDTTEIPNENLPHFLHLQQFEKLPDNVRGYYHCTSAVPPGSRRIIIENNSSEGSPENGQVIRGNSAPIVPKIPEVFTENGSVVAIESESIVNQSAVENQRKIISEGTSVNIGRGLENQIQNLENKVVQIHIIEDSEEATTNNGNLTNDIGATLNTHQRNGSSTSDTVIIQSNIHLTGIHQHNVPHSDQLTKIIADDNCVIKKHIPQAEEESQQSTHSEDKSQSDPNEDGAKNMPVIDESLGGSTENEITEEIFIPPDDAASNHSSHVQEETSEDLRACEENMSSRRSSICSIYKEMEHIHGENSSIGTTSKNNLESNSTTKSKTVDSESFQDVPCNLSANQTNSEQDVQENCKNSSSSTGSGNALEQITEGPHSCIKNLDQNSVEELNAKDTHSKLETVHTVISNTKKESMSNSATSNSHTSKNDDACNTSPTDLTNFTNPEIPSCTSKDKSELSKTENMTIKEYVASEVEETVLENENHRHVSKKLRTAKMATTNIPEGCPSDGKSGKQDLHHEEVKEINKVTELHKENVNNYVEDVNEIVAPSSEVAEVVPHVKDSLLLDTKERSCKENESADDNSVKTILQIPNAKINKSCAIICQSSNENLIPVKDNFVSKSQDEAKLELSETTLDELNNSNSSSSPIEDVQIKDDNNQKATSELLTSNKHFENTCHRIEDLIDLDKNEETTHHHESIIEEAPTDSKESVNKASNQKGKNVAEDTEHFNSVQKQTNLAESVRKGTSVVAEITEIRTETENTDINTNNTQNCEEPISEVYFKNAEENVIFFAESDHEKFVDEADPENYMQTITPLNLSMDKKCFNEPKPKSTKIRENQIETSPILNNQVEETCIANDIDDPLNTASVSTNNEILKPANLTSLVRTSKKPTSEISASEISSSAKSNLKRAQTRSASRKKEKPVRNLSPNLLAKMKKKRVLDVVPKNKENLESEKLKEENIEQQVGVSKIADASIDTELENRPKCEKENKAENASIDTFNPELGETDSASEEEGISKSAEEEFSKSAEEEEEISKSADEEFSKPANFDLLEEHSKEKMDIPELVPAISTKSKSNAELKETKSPEIEEGSKNINNPLAKNTENLENISEFTDINAELTDSSEATMPVLECMINYHDELEPSRVGVNKETVKLEGTSKRTKRNCDLANEPSKVKGHGSLKSKNAAKEMEHFDIVRPEKISQKKVPRVSKKIKEKTDIRRKSRRLNRYSPIRSQEINEEEERALQPPSIEFNGVVENTEVVIENPPKMTKMVDGIVETTSDHDSFENSHTVEEETCLESVEPEHHNSLSENVEITDDIMESNNLEEKIESIDNFEQIRSLNDDQKILSDENIYNGQQMPNIPADAFVIEDEPNACLPDSEPEKDYLEETETNLEETNESVSNQEEVFEENADAGIVYQINDTNVVLQIADELLEINVSTQNGRKIISVKTFSNAIIMNNSEETNCQTFEDTCATQHEEPNSVEMEVQKLCESETETESETLLNNNYIDFCNDSDLKNDNTEEINDESNFCFKEICAAPDITTVGDDVFIYNEEVVSSSTEIETVPKLPNDKDKEQEQTEIPPTDDKNVHRKYVTRKSSKKDKKVSWEDEKHDIIDKTKCLIDDPPKISQKDTTKSKINCNISESSSNKKSTTIKDSLRKSPKTKAALKFVETVKTSKTKVKEPKVPLKTTDNLKTNRVEICNLVSDKKVAKSVRKRRTSMEQSSLKEDNSSDSASKNTPRQKYHSQVGTNKNESHNTNNKNKQDLQDKIGEKLDEVHKTKENDVHKMKVIEVYKTKENDVHKTKENDVHKTKEIEVYKTKENDVHKIKEIEVHKIKENDVHKTKENEVHKTKEKPQKKDSEKGKEVNVQKNKRSLSPKEEKTNHKSSKLPQAPKKKLKIDKANMELPKTTTSKPQAENKKNQRPPKVTEQTQLKNVKGNINKKDNKDVIHTEISNPKVHKEVESKKTKNKSSEEQPKTRSRQKIEDKQDPVEKEELISEETQISVQENSITSSTSQENEASVKERSSKLIQQITDEWDDDSDDLKAIENSSKRRLSLQEYNSRKRTNSETIQACDLSKPDLTDNLLGNGAVLIGNKLKRETSPESPILSVKFNNKTYSRSSSVFALKSNAIPNTSNFEQDVILKDATVVLNCKKEEPLSSAIELHLPKINRSPRPVYNQEYLRNALMNDLQAVNAYTTTLIKENQQLMQRFLEQKRLTADELKKVKTIIRYKRLVQHLSTIRINEMQTTRENHVFRQDTDHLLYPSVNASLNPAAHLKLTSHLSVDICDVNNRQSNLNQIVNTSEKSKMNQLHLEENVKVNVEKRKKKRFRFLYSDEETESHNASATFASTALTDNESNLKRPRLDSSVPALERKVMDYSVHQSNSQGQLTLVFKRSFKSDPKMQPFVRLERLPSIDLLAKNRLC